MLGGRTINRLTNNAYSIASQHIVSFAYEYYNIDSRDAHFFASNNMAVRREVFFSCGEFDPTFRTSEDRELCNRFVLIGLKLNYAPEAVVYHIHNLSFSKFCKQHFNYGRGAYCYHLNRANKEDAINVIGHLRFFINSGKSCFTEQQAYCLTMRAKIVSLFFVWQLANLFGFLFQKFCNSKNDSENP
jgi:GT2 family glycosyltransferase